MRELFVPVPRNLERINAHLKSHDRGSMNDCVLNDEGLRERASEFVRANAFKKGEPSIQKYFRKTRD